MTSSAEPPGLFAAVDALPYGFAILAADGRLMRSNRLFRALLDIAEDAASEVLATALNTGDRPLIQVLAGSGPWDLRLPGGGAELRANPIEGGGLVLTLEPLAERRRIEADAKRAQKVALVALADLAEYRDGDTGEHVLRVARMTHEMARTLLRKGVEPETCTEDFLRHIGIASILHDVGKVSIPDAVLLKPGVLDAEERIVMQRHAANGGAILSKAERLLAGSEHFRLAGDISKFHHEYWDGSGYPRHLKGDQIPLAARIVAVADVFDALTSKRPYKEPWTAERAVAFIMERSGTQFDPTVVRAFLDVLSMREKATVLEWSDRIAIGHPLIDHDHRILLALINQIANPENSHDQAAVEFVLDELVNYTYFHFTHEEDLMAEAGYPDLERHRQIHAGMISEVEDLQRRFAERADIGDELSQFLSMWLVNHIMQEDRLYRPFLVKE